jgi:hypothetical protein
VVSNSGAPPYRQDTGAMQGAISDGSQGATANNTTAKTPGTAAADAAANAQAAKVMNGIIKMLGTEP